MAALVLGAAAAVGAAQHQAQPLVGTVESAHTQRIRYRPPASMVAIHHSKALVRGIRGPVGSGKSVGCVMECWRIAYAQAPDANGVRRTRIAIVRNTFGELKSTTIKTWQEWVPEDICPIVYDSPIRGLLRAPHPDGKTLVESEIMFVALDKPKDVKKLLSLELTLAWINEAREAPFAVVLALRQRVGRYPGKKIAPLTQAGLIMDTNPPDSDHWWYSLAEERRVPGGDEDAERVDPRDWHFVSQPPALLKVGRKYLPHPEAENAENQPLGYDYWLQQVSGASDEWIKVYLLGGYGFVVDGRPVYPEYRDNIHVAEAELQPIEGLPLLLGWDFGLTPACIVGQVTLRGQLRIICEFVSERMGIDQFSSEVVRPQLAIRFPGWDLASTIVGAGDPSGDTPAETDEATCFQVLQANGFSMVPARTNSFIPRKDAVVHFLNRMDAGVPSFLMSPSCRRLRKGFLGGYHYRRMQVTGKNIYRDEPDKDEFSHPQDGLQYLALFALYGDTRPADEARKSLPNPRRRRKGLLV